MKTIVTDVDLFDMPTDSKSAILITTNGIVKSNGYAVMGKGIAKQADDLFHVAWKLGRFLMASGNQCYDLGVYIRNGNKIHLITFPTKDHWRYKSKLGLIEQSAIQVLGILNNMDIDTVYMPPAGCGNGGLKWDTQVSPILSKWLDDRFVVVLKEGTYLA